MKSLWAYTKGMVGLFLPFTAINSSILAVWTRFGISTLFEARLLLLYMLVLPNSSMLVATLYLGPMKSLWAYTKGMVGLSLTIHSDQQLHFGCLDQIWHFDPL